MRLDARDGVRATVWHVPRCQEIKRCVWVDLTTAEYGCYPDREAMRRIVLSGLDLDSFIQIHKAKKIVHYPKKALILIDPIDDEPERLEDIVTKNLEKHL